MTVLYVFIAALAGIVVAGYVRPTWSWTGLRAADENTPRTKTLWDWLVLLIVPFVLAAGAYAINRAQTSRDEEREAARIEQQDSSTGSRSTAPSCASA